MHILVVPEGEGIEKLFEKRQVSRSTESKNKINPNRPTTRHIIIKRQKVRQRENLKNSKRKAVSYLQGPPITLSDDFSTETAKRLAQNIQGNGKQGPTTKITLPSKAIV